MEKSIEVVGLELLLIAALIKWDEAVKEISERGDHVLIPGNIGYFPPGKIMN